MKPTRAAAALLSLAVLVLPAACGGVRPQVRGGEQYPEAGPEADRTSGRALRAARGLLEAGRFQEALDGFEALSRECSGCLPESRAYREALERVHQAALADRKRQDYAAAGLKYRLLLTKLAVRPASGLELGFTRESLKVPLDECREGLARGGFAEYRRGNLAGAIVCWESLLAFDPGNEPIRRAAETARIQLHGHEERNPRR